MTTYHYKTTESVGSRRLIIQSLLMTAFIFILLPCLELWIRKMPDLKVRTAEVVDFRPKPPQPPQVEKKERPRLKPHLRQTKMQMPLPLQADMRLDLGAAGDFAINLDFNPEIVPEDLIFESEEVDQPPRVKAQMEPVYPYAAKSKGIEGSVTLRFVVEPSGTVREESITMLEEQPARVFSDAARQAVRQWTFVPGTMQGEAVPVWVRITIHFKLDK